MKSVQSLTGSPIKFSHDATNVYEIPYNESIEVPDDHAVVIEERLGSQVSVSDVQELVKKKKKVSEEE